MLGFGACVLVPDMLRMCFALALMPLVLEMVTAYARLRWTSHTFWILCTAMLWMFFALAVMPLVVDMVPQAPFEASCHPRTLYAHV